jgi:hypothetical protein
MSKRREQRPLDRIAPDDLPEQVDADVETVDDAVEYLHKFGQSTTSFENRPRCPECGTVRIGPATGYPEQREGGEEYEYKCTNWHRFDDPAPPLAEVDDDADEVGRESDESDDDPFRWLDADDLADPPLRRRLAQLDDRSLTALAIVLYAPWNHTDADPSYRDLGDLFPYSRDWVGERVRAWRDGEFRDLVADPRPWRVDQ